MSLGLWIWWWVLDRLCLGSVKDLEESSPLSTVTLTELSGIGIGTAQLVSLIVNKF